LLHSLGDLLCRRLELLRRRVKLQRSGGGWQYGSAGSDTCPGALGLNVPLRLN
jgi:hypothetical protein